MKESPLSTCERNFILKTVKGNQRLDGRQNREFRSVKINFGADYGSVHVALGQTRVLAQVSCELGIPKSTRPNEGILFINVELGPMAAVHFESGRNSNQLVQLNRILEKTFKDSQCIDLESLCVISEDRVWILRLDINVLNHEGNLTDCCSIAGLCALAHFKRPDVTIQEDGVLIHSEFEKEFIPNILHHFPVCVSYVSFYDGETIVADPTLLEERTAESCIVFGINSYHELCCLNLAGTTLTTVELLLQTTHRAAKRAKEIVEMVKEKLEQDAEIREENKPVGFTECLKLNNITTLVEDRLVVKLRSFKFSNIHEDEVMETEIKDEKASSNIVSVDEHTGILNSEQDSIHWAPEESLDEDSEADGDSDEMDDQEDEDRLENEIESALSGLVRTAPPKKGPQKPLLSKKIKTKVTADSDSEEDVTIVLE